jgi:hypothetical protein
VYHAPMTKKPHVNCTGLVAACVCLMLAALALLPTHANVTKASFDRIEKGMTPEEAGLILERRFGLAIRNREGRVSQRFTDNRSNATIMIVFDDGVVSEKHWEDSGGVLKILRRWLRLA